MTSAKISGIVSNLASMDTGLTETAGTVEKGLCATAQASFASVMEQKTSGYGTEQLTSGKNQTKETSAPATQQTNLQDSTSKLNVKESSPTQTVKKMQDQLEDTKDAFETGVKDILKEELGVTDEQVEDAMAVLGLEWMDLLNPASLSQLVTQLTGTEDACSLLMSEEFTSIMQKTDALAMDMGETLGISKDDWVMLQNQLAEMTAEEAASAGLQTDNVEGAENLEMPEQTEQTDNVQNQKNLTASETVAAGMAQTSEETPVMQPEEENADEQTFTVNVNETVETKTEENVSEDASEEMEDSGTSADNAKAKESNVADHPQTMEFQVKDNLQTAVLEETNVTAPRPAIDVQDIMNQITEFARVNISQENSSIEMQLNPENLGKVYLHIAATKEGNITAELAVSNEAVKTALEAQIADLRTSLNQQGVKVDAVEVTIASHEFERNLEQNAAGEEQQAGQQEQTGRTAGRRIFRGELDELSGLMNEEEILAAQIMKDHGNTMDVTA